ncbi:MAG: hypothetical protein EXR27_04680 [Betaproteobacteria bacterium]|nr:hypothetical protein [Betaproteobacteria bacterium]
MYQFVVILKGVNEVALMAMIGQAALFVLAGARREGNFVYALFKAVTAPIMKTTRFIAPRFVIDAHIGFLAFFLLLLLEAILILLKVRLYFSAMAG